TLLRSRQDGSTPDKARVAGADHCALNQSQIFEDLPHHHGTGSERTVVVLEVHGSRKAILNKKVFACDVNHIVKEQDLMVSLDRWQRKRGSRLRSELNGQRLDHSVFHLLERVEMGGLPRSIHDAVVARVDLTAPIVQVDSTGYQVAKLVRGGTHPVAKVP